MSHHPSGPSTPMSLPRGPEMRGDAGAGVVDLWLRPRRFFTQLGSDRPKALVIAACVLAGISHAQDRLDNQFMKAAMGRGRVAIDAINAWEAYWGISLAVGVTISAFLVWIWYGWWYRVRLRWCGVEAPDITRTRDVSVLASIVQGVPGLLYAVYETASYATPLDAASGDDLWGLSLIVFAYWSVWVSYCGATTVFPAQKGKARVFFLVLPIIFYTLVLGLLGLLGALGG